jgi:hypothetical protein
MQDTTKFFIFWIQFFDSIEKHWPKEKKGKSSGPSGSKMYQKAMF